MAERSAIEWTDSTHNPWSGCTKISPACDHCYAAALSHRLGSLGQWGAGEPRKRTSEANRKQPLRWNAQPFYECHNCGARGTIKDLESRSNPGLAEFGATGCCEVRAWFPARRRVFCASLADWLDNEVPIEWLADLLDTIRRTPNLDWLLLTKRVGNWGARLSAAHDHAEQAGASDDFLCWLDWWIAGLEVPTNVWIGATICNQAEADRDIPKLLRAPARVRFLSMEPLLGAVSLPFDHIDAFNALAVKCDQEYLRVGLHWIIAGGESGHHARPSHPDWLRSLRDQCAEAGVAFLFKQWGEWAPLGRDDTPGSLHFGYVMPRDGMSWTHDSGFCKGPETLESEGFRRMHKLGKKAAGRLLDGVEHNGFPLDAPAQSRSGGPDLQGKAVAHG